MGNNSIRKVAGAFLLGGLIGASVAVLYAPKSGIETRKEISKAAKRFKKRAYDIIDDTIDSINNFTEEMKDRAEDIIERGMDISKDAKEEIINTFEKAER